MNGIEKKDGSYDLNTTHIFLCNIPLNDLYLHDLHVSDLPWKVEKALKSRLQTALKFSYKLIKLKNKYQISNVFFFWWTPCKDLSMYAIKIH